MTFNPSLIAPAVSKESLLAAHKAAETVTWTQSHKIRKV